MKHYEEFGFAYISPSSEQRAMATQFQVASRATLKTLSEMQEDQTLIKNAGLEHNDGVNAIAQKRIYGQQVIGFMAAAHQTTHLAFADVGLFRDVHYNNSRQPKIERLCAQVKVLGDTTLKMLGLTQPLPLEDAQELYPEDSALPSATVGIMRYTDHSVRRRETGVIPRAFINISDQPQTWHIGHNEPSRRKTFVQERGGIVIYETRTNRTQNPNPHYILEAYTGEVGAQLMVSTTQDTEFDKHFQLT